jgi:hypothetical protein
MVGPPEALAFTPDFAAEVRRARLFLESALKQAMLNKLTRPFVCPKCTQPAAKKSA